MKRRRGGKTEKSISVRCGGRKDRKNHNPVFPQTGGDRAVCGIQFPLKPSETAGKNEKDHFRKSVDHQGAGTDLPGAGD